MKVLITGANGFVGSHLTKYLHQQGLDLQILVRNISQAQKNSYLNSSKITFVEGDITDPSTLKNALHNCDHVFHLAGVVGYSKAQRLEMEKVNVQGTANLIEACKQSKIKKFLHFSSVVAVGASFTPETMNEDSKYNLSHLDLGYFETKKKAEELVREAFKKGFFDCTIVNPSTIYGYGDAQKGSRKIQVKVAQGKFPLYPPGGQNIVSIEDVVECTFKAWKIGRSGERYILSGENLLIKDVFSKIAKLSGAKPPQIGLSKNTLLAIGKVGDFMEKINLKGPINTENAWTSVLYHWFDNSKAVKELGLKPKSADYALEQSVQWMKDNGVLN